MNKLVEEIDNLNEKYIEVWKDVCRIESPTNYKEGIDKVGNYFIEMAEKRGFLVEVFEQEKAGNVVSITLNPNVKNKPVTISGHIDTVHPVGLFKEPIVHTDGENIYGPGVADCKGGVVAGFMAMEALNHLGFNKRPVMLLIQTDEEVGSKLSNNATIKYICEKAKDSIAFLNCEPYCGDNKLILSRKGILRYKINVKGKAAHSALCMNGCNAITEAAKKILKLEDLKDREGITCNCGMIEGGTTPNTVAENCTFMADFRCPTKEDMLKAEQLVKEVCKYSENPLCSCSVEQVSLRPTMPEVKQNFDLLDKINKIFVENGMPCMEAKKGMSGSDAAYATEYEIPCVDCIGPEGHCLHSINEYAKLNSLTESAKRLALIAYYIN